jgi:hypothetical protein
MRWSGHHSHRADLVDHFSNVTIFGLHVTSNDLRGQIQGPIECLRTRLEQASGLSMRM